MDEMPSSSSSWIRFTGFRSCCRDLLCRDSWKRDRNSRVSTDWQAATGEHGSRTQGAQGSGMAGKPGGWLFTGAESTFPSHASLRRPAWLEEM